MSLQYLKKEVRGEVDFLRVDKRKMVPFYNILGIKPFYKVIQQLLMGMNKHSQRFQSNKFAIYLQYIKKEVGNGIHFLHADKHQSFYKFIIVLMEVTRHVQSTKNRKLVIFLQYIQKKVSQLLLCLILIQKIGYFMKVQSCSLLLVFWWLWPKMRAAFQIMEL